MSPGKIITRYFKDMRTDCYTGIRLEVPSDHYITWVNVLDVNAAFIGRAVNVMLTHRSGYGLVKMHGSAEGIFKKVFNVAR